MEVARVTDQKKRGEEEDEDDVMLPGYRFHPTDEELVGFYLRRKVEKKPLSIELIKQIDIYKHDPWDLPKVSLGDKEWYFFCMRGRKYRNSVRPNRVTGSGFWKATGIDRPIYSPSDAQDCIGLKKSLVYYRGSAGKGTKTDWMMHEFRLPPANAKDHHNPNAKNIAQEAEVWTLCRIFKRVQTYKRYTPDLKDTKIITQQHKTPTDSCSKTSSFESETCERYLSFGDSSFIKQNERNLILTQLADQDQRNKNRFMGHMNMISRPPQAPLMTSFWDPNYGSEDDFFVNGNWDELRSVVELAKMDSSLLYGVR